MTHKKRNLIIILAAAALALVMLAALLSACKGGGDDDGEKDGTAAETGVITIVDGGSLPGTYEVAIGTNVYTYMQDKIPEKEHYEFAYWTYEGEELTRNTGLTMTGSVTLTAVYKVEVTLAVYAENMTGYEEWQDTGDYTHFASLDTYDYVFAGETYTASVSNIEGLTRGQNTDLTITVSSDYTKNVIPLYYTRNLLSVQFTTNYPADSLKSDETRTVTEYYGYPVELPTGFTCDGYLMLGWSTTSGATNAEYSVDCISGKLLVWDASTKSYVLSEARDPEPLYPTRTMRLYITWTKGYTDMFGGSDTVFILGDDDSVAYLYRGGYYWESDRKVGTEYYFLDNYGTNPDRPYYRVQLSAGYLFTYWEERISGDYYRYDFELEYETNPDTGETEMFLGGAVDRTEYVYFSEHDEVGYYRNGTSTGTYKIGDDGYTYELTFTTGNLTGQTMTIVLGTYTSGSDVTAIFLIQNEDEADMGLLPMGTVTYSESSGIFSTYYYTTYYYLSLDGFHDCVYYAYGTAYTYRYWLDDDMLYLFGTSSGTLAGTFKAVMTDVGTTAWFLYYSTYDTEFDVYDLSGTEIGTVKCDGYMNAVYTDLQGNTSTGLYSLTTLVDGSAMYLKGTGAEEGRTYSKFLIETDAEGVRSLHLVPYSYTMLYYYGADGIDNDILVLDSDGEGTAKYVVLGYDWYGNGYYFTVLKGTYEIYYNETYGMSYYVFTVTEAIDWTEYFEDYIYIYYSAVDIADYNNMTEIGFTVAYYGSYLVDLWLWYDTADPEEEEPAGISTFGAPAVETYDATENSGGGTDADSETNQEDPPWAGDDSVILFDEHAGDEQFEFTFFYEIYELNQYNTHGQYDAPVSSGNFILEGQFNYLIIDGGLVVGGITGQTTAEDGDAGGTSTETYVWSITGNVYGTFETEDGVTITYLYLSYSMTVSGEARNYEVDLYTYVFVQTETDETTETSQVTKVPVHIYTEGGETGARFGYNLIALGDDHEVEYSPDGSTTYTGTIAKNNSLSNNVYGYTIYTFTSTDGSVSANIIFLTSEGEAVFAVYNSADEKTYTGTNGDKVQIDPTGNTAVYTNKNGKTYKATTGNFRVEYDSDSDSIEYIQIKSGYDLITLDFTDETFTVRGFEYGKYTIVDYFQDQYLAILDGEGKVYVYNLDETSFSTPLGSGTYTMVDTVIEMSYTIGGETQTVTGVVDIEKITSGAKYAFRAEGTIYADNTEFLGTYVNDRDYSVIVLSGDETATRYTAEGTIEKGEFVWLDNTYFHYESSDGTFGATYRVKEDNFNVVSEDYGTVTAKYYSKDLSTFFEFTSGGLAIFGDETCYYTLNEIRGESGTVISVNIYYIPDGSTEVETNVFGYAVYDGFGQIKETFEGTSGTYYNISYEGASLKRVTGEENKYNFVYGSEHYDLGQLVMQTSSATGEEIEVTMYYGEGGRSRTAYIDIGTEEDENGEEKTVVTLFVNTSHAAYRYGYYTYYDYLYYIYTIEVDLSEETGTYSISGANFYMRTFLDDYMAAYYYGYPVAPYYYSYIDFVWTLDETGAATSSKATGLLLPYLLGGETEGGTVDSGDAVVDEGAKEEDVDNWTSMFVPIEGVDFEVTVEDGTTFFYLTVKDNEDNEYVLKVYVGFSHIWNAAYLYNSFYIENLWSPIEFTVESTENETKYNILVGYEIYSDSYSTTNPHVEITREAEGEETATRLNILISLEIEGDIYCLMALADEDGDTYSQYLKLSFTECGSSENGYTLQISVATEITSYATDEGFVDVYENSEAQYSEVLVIYKRDDRTFYRAMSSEQNDDGTFTVESADGYTYVITLDETEKTAELTKAGDEDESDEDGQEG